MSERAIETLKAVSRIACEDTRTSGVLLSHYGISTPTTSFHAHNEHGKATRLVESMIRGDDIALISDAGSPGISDPGYLLVRAALDAHLEVTSFLAHRHSSLPWQRVVCPQTDLCSKDSCLPKRVVRPV